MKTVGLLQLMAQAGLLIPADAVSEIGIFKQVMIHIGDTQSIEHELSTYSAHLQDMKYFMQFANGKTLFFIDELGSGSDPNLGGSFAEAIVEHLAKKTRPWRYHYTLPEFEGNGRKSSGYRKRSHGF